MILEYLLEQIQKAQYELIDKGKRYYGEIPNLRGVWATGKSLEECRANLLETLEGWLTIRLKKNLALPKLKTRERKKIAVYV
ncbi:MAG: type II toxin-antitoxin system HicB family antitoxin [Patescibacteria group bacterium]